MTTYKEAKEKLEELNSKYTAYDFKWEESVSVIDDDNSHFFFRHAFVKKWHEWYFVFSEHNPPQAYHEDECKVLYLKNLEIPEIIAGIDIVAISEKE